MIDILLEHPWIVLGIGLICSLASIQAALQLGKKELLWLAGLIAVVSSALCYAGNAIVTERESLVLMLNATAEALSENDEKTVLDAIYPNPSRHVLDTKSLLKQVQIGVFRITKIFDVRFSGPHDARRAKVALNVYIEATFHGMTRSSPRYIELVLYRVEDTWLVFDYTDAAPIQGFKDPLTPDGQ